MNKKVVSLISLLPVALASCHGASISRADALRIIDSIEKENDEKLPFSVFTFTIETDEENNKSTTKHFFSVTDKYYYTYSYLNGAVSEEWEYVQKDENDIEHIYSVSRIVDSSVNEETAPRYAYNAEEYDEELWKEKELHYVTILLRETYSIITSIKSYLDSEPGEGSTLTLESSGSHNVYVARSIVDDKGEEIYYKDALFNNSRLVSYIYKAKNLKRNRKYTVNYSSIEIFYPKIDQK